MNKKNKILCAFFIFLPVCFNLNSENKASKSSKLESIEIYSRPEKIIYIKNEPLDVTGLKVRAIYEDGSKKMVQNYKLKGFNSKKYVENQLIKITYSEKGITKSSSFSISVKELFSINVTNYPAKKSYFEGDNFDDSELVVTALYEDKSTQIINNYKHNFDEIVKESGNNKKVSIMYGGKETYFNIDVIKVVVESIKVVQNPKKLNYFTDDVFDSEGLELSEIYNNGVEKKLDKWETNFNEVVKNPGENKILTIQGQGKETYININVKPIKLEKIEISKYPEKTEYFAGDEFNSLGLEIKGYYNNGKTRIIEDWKTNFDDVAKEAGNIKEVKIFCEDVETNFFVKIKEVVLDKIEITENAKKLEYFTDDDFDSDGMEVTGIFNNGKTEILSGWTTDFENVKNNPGKNKTVKVYFEDKSTSFKVDINAVVLDSIFISHEAEKIDYYEGDKFNNQGLEISGIYNNGKKNILTGWTTNFDEVVKNPGKSKKVKIIYENFTTEFFINVNEVLVEEIEVSKLPNKQVFESGEQVDLKGLEISATYNNGTKKLVNGWTTKINAPENNLKGKASVEVIYKDFTTRFNIIIGYAFHDKVTVLPKGTMGSAGPDETYVIFGDWPQSVKNADVLVDESNKILMGNHTYYLGDDGNWYISIIENGNDSEYLYSDGTNVQKKKGKNKKYYKVEPIKWRVVTKNYNGTKKALLVAENILMSNVSYFPENKIRLVNGKRILPNNYQFSQIRAWLNGLDWYDYYNRETFRNINYKNKGFLQTAFTVEGQNAISITKVKDKTSETTSDKIFLLSVEEVNDLICQPLELSENLDENLAIRFPTDFAYGNKVWKGNIDTFGSCWWLRSENDTYKNRASFVYDFGNCESDVDVSVFEIGVVPAICVPVRIKN